MDTQQQKKNCWEFTGCGRQPGGQNEQQLGTCPAATDERLHGVHDGKNAGRSCWMIAGTFCQGTVHGTFAQKLKDCNLCQFYQSVRKQEGMGYQIPLTLFKKLKERA